MTAPVLAPYLSQQGRMVHRAFEGDRRALCGVRIARHGYAIQATETCTKCARAMRQRAFPKTTTEEN